MKLTVFGATGGVGTEVVKQALAAGRHVTAVVRDPSRLEVEDELLEVVVAELSEHGALTEAVSGRDVVISALGARERRPTTVVTDGAHAALAALRSAGGRRLLLVSASGPFVDGDGFFTGNVVKPILGKVLRHPFADMVAAERIVRASELDWTIVRPPRLLNGPHTGVIAARTDGNVRGGFSINRADVADYLLRAASDDSLIRQTVSIAKG
ncbi:NAD(P)-dependent oxidoreductase [Amycolatopsis regifaucium]|uniref:NADH-flavin reductase n=1 Tax=Amycolatopsis regifaucium TaxID=546365 RepID=A0A154MB10_9PSEU|nr:NAD(P)H-binding protein [Amycolatopsis regifaucium]KZB81742.1 NADH-flavin reductase [Amycolatopsis regifaucium]OKA06192.1 NADH-flavin reductase [Amycolatopsis regifaucium]SFG69929.1 Putative NADH-flavin reductase [Amycolatopsis regifaucium]